MTDRKRRAVIAGNWKMFKTIAATKAYFEAFLPLVRETRDDRDIIVAPPFTAISTAVAAVAGTAVAIGGQNLYWGKEAALTGAICAGMLAEAGCKYVIVGHSERRLFFHETDDNIAKKALSALQEGLMPIVCVGETEAERDAGLAEEVLRRQFRNGPGALTVEDFSRILLAYEPVWAIGTGRMATPELAARAHRHLRECVAEQYSVGHATGVRILYGGSVKPDNIQGLMAESDEIDGALVGGASLDAQSFARIVNFAS